MMNRQYNVEQAVGKLRQADIAADTRGHRLQAARRGTARADAVKCFSGQATKNRPGEPAIGTHQTSLCIRR